MNGISLLMMPLVLMAAAPAGAAGGFETDVLPTSAGDLKVTFIAALEAGDEADTIKITGSPDLEVTLKGTNGDIATVAIAVNAIRRVREAPPGLVTMRDLPLVTYW